MTGIVRALRPEAGNGSIQNLFGPLSDFFILKLTLFWLIVEECG